MLKRVLQVASLFALAGLLLCAPEIYEAVSAPYRVEAQRRALLRVALCAQDAEASAVYKALDAFRAERPGAHLRVLRVDASQLAALAEPLPDAYIFPEGALAELGTSGGDSGASPASGAPERLFAPLGQDEAGGVLYAAPVLRAGCEGLLCAVGQGAREAEEAMVLALFLQTE